MLKGSELDDAKRQAIAHFVAGSRVPATAHATGIGLSTLYAWHRVWRESGAERLLRRPETYQAVSLAQHENEVLDGLMLGDGCLSLGQHSRNPCLSITRTSADMDYLRWTADVFRARLTSSSISVRDVADARTKKTYGSARLRTRCDPAFLSGRDRWYPSGTKVVPEDLSLSAVTVAVWFADDDSVTRASRRSPEIKFATHGFAQTEVRRLADLLAIRYAERFPVYEEGGLGQFTIRAFGPAAKELLRDIDPVFPPLTRKSERWRNSELLTERVPPPECPRCESNRVYYWARTPKGVQQFKCMACNRVFRQSYERAGRDPRPRQGTKP